MLWKFEFTDTFGGEANYCWVERGTVSAETELSAVRRVKAKLGLSGVPCKRSDFGDTVELVPRGSCTVVFITPHIVQPEELEESED